MIGSERFQLLAVCFAATAFFVGLCGFGQWVGAAFVDQNFRDHALWSWINCGPGSNTQRFLLQCTLPTATYWIPVFIYTCLDVFVDVRGTVASVKLRQPSFRPKIDFRLYKAALRQAFFMTALSIVVQGVYFAPLNRFINGQSTVCQDERPWLPETPASFTEAASLLGWLGWRLFLLMALTDGWFYFTHRLCHEVPWLYIHVHKLHHTWVDTYAAAATAAHPLEQFVVNLHTVNLPCMLLGVPWHWSLIWFCLAMVNTTTTHSGFALPFGMKSNVAHDAHHHFPLSEYGTNFLFDRLLRTRFIDRYSAEGRRRATKKDSA